ncbi:hypothetical protein LTS18_014109, partial [Coniosporium uncinatum]
MSAVDSIPQTSNGPRRKLHGRAFYESIGSPKVVLAPMVDQSEFAWRLLSRSFLPSEQQHALLAYTPMFHSRLFVDTPRYRDSHFQALKSSPLPTRSLIADPSIFPEQPPSEEYHLDGNPTNDRPLFVQFCSNTPSDFLSAARYVAPYCDAIDLNLGCPQGIAKRGHYGAFLQEDPDLIVSMIRTLHKELDVPVTAKMRCLETKERTLEYAKKLLGAGASVITVHGRLREQKGHNTGLADWSKIRYLRDNLPPETVIFANGNILQYEDIEKCLQATGADAVMSAEANLCDPSIFAPRPPPGEYEREYWRGRDGKGGYRMDAVMRRYMDIIYRYALNREPPERAPLFIPSDATDESTTVLNAVSDPSPAPAPDANGTHPAPASEAATATTTATTSANDNNRIPQKHPLETSPADNDDHDQQQPSSKKQKKKNKSKSERRSQPKPDSPNLLSMQAHLFHLLRPLISRHTHVRDALARCRAGDMDAYEGVLGMVEEVTKQGLREYAAHPERYEDSEAKADVDVENAAAEEEKKNKEETVEEESYESSLAAVKRCKRPWWVCQSYVRPLPKEAIEKGSLQLSRKELARLEAEKADKADKEKVGVAAEGSVET